MKWINLSVNKKIQIKLGDNFKKKPYFHRNGIETPLETVRLKSGLISRKPHLNEAAWKIMNESYESISSKGNEMMKWYDDEVIWWWGRC